MTGGGDVVEGRPIVYCVVPRELAERLHEPLRRHFSDTPGVEVVVERRGRERRVSEERRTTSAGVRQKDRRRIRAASGRRAGERRALLLPVKAPSLPRRAARYADRLAFIERLEPTPQAAEDRDTAGLVASFQSGDREAFTALYMRYFDRVYAYLKVALNDRHEAEDVTQQVFVVVFEALHRYERRAEPFRAWLFVIVRRQALGRLEKLHRLEVTDPAELGSQRDGPSTAADMDGLPVLDWMTDRELLMFAERLPLAQRQVLLLRFMLDLTHAEIATVLGRSPEDVRILQHRALRYLRDRLTAVGRAPRFDRPSRSRSALRQSLVLRGRRFALHPLGSPGMGAYTRRD